MVADRMEFRTAFLLHQKLYYEWHDIYVGQLAAKIDEAVHKVSYRSHRFGDLIFYSQTTRLYLERI